MFPTHSSNPVSRLSGSLGSWLKYASSVALAIALAGCSAEEKLQDPAPTAQTSTQAVVFSWSLVATNVLKVAPNKNLNYPNYWLTIPTLPGGGHSIVRSWSGTGITTYASLPNNEGAIDIATDSQNNLWAVSNTGNIYRSSFTSYAPGTWVQIPTPAPAADLDALQYNTTTSRVCYLSTPDINGVCTLYKYSYNPIYSSYSFTPINTVQYASEVMFDFVGRVHVITPSISGTGLDLLQGDDPASSNYSTTWTNVMQNIAGHAFAFDGMKARLTNPKRADEEGFPLQISETNGTATAWEYQGVFARQVGFEAYNRPWYVNKSGQLYRAN